MPSRSHVIQIFTPDDRSSGDPVAREETFYGIRKPL